MYNFIVLLKKELKGFLKEFKLLWVPIAFISVGIIQPITMKLLPSIIGEGEGFIIDESIVYTGNEIFAGVFSQLDQIGIIIIAVLLMGAVSNEKKEGILDIILSKGVASSSYLFSKLIAYLILLLPSLILASIFALYYSQVLFSVVSIDLYIKSMLSYSLWFIFVIALGLMFSTVAKTQVQAALATALSAMLLTILPSVVKENLVMLFPSSLSVNAVSIMNGQGVIENFQIATILAIFDIVIVLSIALLHMYKQYRK